MPNVYEGRSLGVEPGLKSSIEIRVCKNGYMVLQAQDMNAHYSTLEGAHVFETFTALVGWLNLNLKHPEKKE